MKNTLYDLSNETKRLDQLLESNEGEITEEIERELINLQENLLNKVDSCAGYELYLKDTIAAIKNRKNQFGALQNRVEKKLDMFKTYLKRCLRHGGMKSVESEFSKITLGDEREQFVFDEDALPEEYFKIETIEKRTIDRDRAISDYRNGINVPGVNRFTKPILRITRRGE